MLLFLLLTLSFVPSDAPYVLVLKNKQLVELQKPPEYKDKLVYLLHVSGKKMTLPVSMVDQEQTERYNVALQEHREKAKRETERLAAEAAAVATEAPAPPPVIKIDNNRDLPEYDRSSNSVTGFQNETVAAPQDVKTFTYKSDDGVYLAQETQTRFADRVVLEGLLKVNHPGQVSEIMVTLDVSLSESGSQQLKKKATPDAGTRGDQLTVRFEIPTNEEVLRTQFSISATVSE